MLIKDERSTGSIILSDSKNHKNKCYGQLSGVFFVRTHLTIIMFAKKYALFL